MIWIAISRPASLLEPLMLFLIAGFIGTIFVGMVFPIFTMQEHMEITTVDNFMKIQIRKSEISNSKCERFSRS